MSRIRRCDVASPRDPHANTSEGGDVSVHGAVELRRANYRWAPDTATPTSPCRIGESSTGNECDNDVGGVAVEVLSAPVVNGRCARIRPSRQADAPRRGRTTRAQDRAPGTRTRSSRQGRHSRSVRNRWRAASGHPRGASAVPMSISNECRRSSPLGASLSRRSVTFLRRLR